MNDPLDPSKIEQPASGNDALESDRVGQKAPADSLHPPRCMGCGYVLQGLEGVNVCPECARTFDLNDSRTFLRAPPFVAWRFWLPGLLLAIGLGIFTGGVLILAFGDMCGSLWLAVPLSSAALVGYRTRVSRSWLPVVGVVLGLGLIGGTMTFQLSGVFCVMILAVITLFPIAIGMALGVALRVVLKKNGFSQGSYLPMLVLAAIPYVWALIEGRPPAETPLETVSTSAIIGAPVGECWDSIVFYEQVTHEPPLLLRVGLARPLSTTGPASRVGDIRRCLYNKGPITKRISEVRTGELLAFEVIEQRIGYERDLRLSAGSFEFEPIDASTTRVTLRSTYEPKLWPRFCWRWGERIAFRTLHEYVLEGMRQRAMPPETRAIVGAAR